jgi:hypothetical protein
VENAAQVISTVAWITPETATVLAMAGSFIGCARYCAARPAGPSFVMTGNVLSTAEPPVVSATAPPLRLFRATDFPRSMASDAWCRQVSWLADRRGEPAFPASRQWHMDPPLVAYSCGYSQGLHGRSCALFPINPVGAGSRGEWSRIVAADSRAI